MAVLSKSIAAIQTGRDEAGKNRMGLIAQLPAGAELEICGEGFNERTVKVRWTGQCYFVFLQDLQPGENVLRASA